MEKVILIGSIQNSFRFNLIIKNYGEKKYLSFLSPLALRQKAVTEVSFKVIILFGKKERPFNQNINANDKIKVLDLDWDGIPEIYSTYESRGEASTCELFGYKDNSYRKIIFPTGDHYCHDMKIKPDGKIEIKEDKKTTKYRYEKGILKEVLRK